MKNSKKSNKRNNKGLVLLLLLILGISIGYAALTANLNINGTSTIGKASWDVHFENLQKNEGNVTATTEAAIDENKMTIDYTVDLAEPGDFYEFTVDVKNGGTLDAKLSDLPTMTGVSTEQDVYVNYTATYADGTPVKAGDVLAKKESKTIKVRVEYDRTITADQLPEAEQSLALAYSMNYIQAK